MTRAQLKKNRCFFFFTNLPDCHKMEHLCRAGAPTPFWKNSGGFEAKNLNSKNQKSFFKPFIICDRALMSVPEVKSWLKKNLVYSVSAGEELKNINHFPKHINNILKKNKK